MTSQSPSDGKRSRNASPRALLQNAATNYANLVAGTLLSLVSTPIYFHALGIGKFATLSLMAATVAYLDLVEVGLGTSSINRIAALEETDPAAFLTLARTTIVMYRYIGLAAMALALAFTPFFSLVFAVPHGLRGQVPLAFLCYGASVATLSSAGAYGAILYGTGRMHLVNSYSFAVTLITTLASLLAAVLGAPLIVLAAVQILSSVIQLVAARWQVRRAFPDILDTAPRLDSGTAKSLLRVGLPNGVTSAMSTFAYGSDLPLVGLLINVREVAAYAIALRASAFFGRVITAAASALGPSHANRRAGSDEERFDLYCVTALLTAVPAVAIIATVCFYAQALISLWLGHAPSAVAPILVLSALVFVAQIPVAPATVLLQAAEDVKAVMWTATANAVVNICASIIFTELFGVTGPMLGTLTAVALVDGVIYPRRVCRLLHRSTATLIRRLVGPIAAPSCLIVALLAIGHQFVHRGVLILPVIAVAWICYLGAIWLSPTARGLRTRLRTAN